GNLLYSRGAIMDYSERKKLEEDLELARQSAEKSVVLKEQFVANISHEIRTPLNAILGFSNLLQRTDLQNDQVEFARNIQMSSENLLAIINDILDFSKIEAGMLHLDKVPFSLPALIHSVRNLFNLRAREKKLRFQVHVEDGLPDNLIGDPTRITQILVNLLGNAFKFTEKGEISLSVAGRNEEENTMMISFEVKDTGIGIPQEKIEKIFERFGQATAETTRRFGGTGLGLTISKQLVELQNGTITVSSQVGQGATFRVEIPYEIASEKVQSPPVSTPLQEVNGHEVSVLIVEDNPMNQRILELILDEWGIRHRHANNGLQAIKLLSKQVFDLVFMDIQMPEMDGYSTASMIRQKLHLKVPIIATTAHAFPGEREKCISYGMNDYISKPIHQDELYSLILRYIAKDTGQTDVSAQYSKDSAGFDRQYIQDITQGRTDTIAEMANLFIDQSEKELEKIDAALRRRDFSTLAKAAHSLKSTTAYMGFNKDLGEKVTHLEMKASGTNPKLAELRSLITVVKKSREKAIEFLRTEFIHEV
ncbi:MAG: response regulator, partial [Saprospiraceae bacterium]|nr:response regulator [Saprospiraceae bacterium]